MSKSTNINRWIGFGNVRDLAVATSVPTFFHHDVALLWSLSVVDEHTLEQWKPTVTAWRQLLCWWLLGDVEEERVAIEGQFAHFVPTDAEGQPAIKDITWLVRRTLQGKKYLGCLSPFGFVRPAPATDLADRAAWPNEQPWQDPRCQWLLNNLIQNLSHRIAEHREGEPTHRYLRDLLRIVQEQFPALPPGTLVPTTASLLQLLEPTRLGRISMYVGRRGGGERSVYIPRCSSVACGRALLPITLALTPGQNEYVVTCECGAESSLRLRDFGVAWNLTAPTPELIVWLERNWRFSDDNARMAPQPVIDGSAVRFAYSPAIPGVPLAELNRSVTLSCQAEAVKICPIADIKQILYSTPLICGPDGGNATTKVLPLRPEYLFVLDRRAPVGVETSVAGKTFEFRLHGLPSAIKKTFAAVRHEPAAGVALFPDPAKVLVQWKSFRIAASPGIELVSAEHGEQRVSDVFDVSGEPPTCCSIQSAADGNVGATLFWSFPHRDRLHEPADPADRSPETAISLDFGTTNSLVYLAFDDAGTRREEPFRPHVLRRQIVRWIIDPEAEGDRDTALNRILPLAGRHDDDAVIPSELCRHALIAWGALPCCSSAADVRHLFKNDDRSTVRKQFLCELLKHVLAGYFGRRMAPPRALTANLVCTYPLTFNTAQRNEYKAEVAAVVHDVADDTGVTFAAPTFLDESSAGVQALGVPNANDVVVCADLGGGTLDVSVGRGLSARRDFIGSLDAGGRFLIEAIAGMDSTARYELQSAIRSRAAAARTALRTDEAREQMLKFYSYLWFYLETLILAYRNTTGATDSWVVKLYLLGNGWRFPAFLAEPFDDPAEVCARQIDAFAQNANARLASSGITIDVRRHDPPKHAVAAGAIKAQMIPRTDDIMLPAGIDCIRDGATLVPWYAPVGPNAGLPGLDDSVAFDLQTFAQHLRSSENYVQANSAGDVDRYEDAVRGALLHVTNRSGGLTNRGIYRGPLQLLLEEVWVKRLRAY